MAKNSTWSFVDSEEGYSPSSFSKQNLIRRYFTKMVDITLSMFEWKGLPETIPQKQLELILQKHGYAIIVDSDKKPQHGTLGAGKYACYGGLTALDPYYKPTQGTVANPYLNFSKTVSFNKDSVIILNDNCYQGLRALHSEYAMLLAENALSIRYALVNARIPTLPYADNDKTATSLKTFFKNVFEGTESVETGLICPVVGGNGLFEGLKNAVYNQTQSQILKDLIEARQFLWASWFIEVGVQANYNMKREAINESEAGMNMFSLAPYTNDMLLCRQKGADEMNKLWGTKVTVEFSSIWKKIAEIVEKMPVEEEPKQDTPEEKDPDEGGEENDEDKDA